MYKFVLEPYNGIKSRFTCPNCGKKHEYERYINAEGEYLPYEYGKCNREQKCGYWLKPNGDVLNLAKGTFKRQEEKPMDTLQKSEMYGTIPTDSNQDNLFRFLSTKFDIAEVYKAYERYDIRVSNDFWNGTTIFYQKDIHGAYRTGKAMLYDLNGKRVKKPFNHINWVHRRLRREFNLKQCLFGEHLLNGAKNVYLVESEKTAIIGYLSLPNTVWVATGGLNHFPSAIKSVLRYIENVYAIPDKGSFELWKEKIGDFVKMSYVVENEESLTQGDDIADLILR